MNIANAQIAKKDTTAMDSLSSIHLDDVVVVGKKNVVKREIDRLVIDVSKLPHANFTLLDLLKQSPGVRADDNHIQMIGKGTVKIYIDGRETKASGNDLTSLLRSYSSQDVQRLEIITNPSAVYEAEGNAGIINIVLKRQFRDYLGGNLSEMLVVNKWTANEYSGALHYNQGILTASLNISGGLGKHGFEQQFERRYTSQSQQSRTTQANDNTYFCPRLSFDVTLPYKWSVGGIIGFLRMTPDCGNSTVTDVRDMQYSLLQTVNGATALRIISRQQEYNIHADKSFGESKVKLSVDADAVLYKTSSDDDYSSNTDFRFHSLLDRHIEIYSVKANVNVPWKRWMMDVGGKYSSSSTRNDYTLSEAMPYMQEDRFSYQENIWAAYADALWKISKKWQVKLGLRMENTHTDGYSLTKNNTTTHDYTELFPSAYISYKPKDNHVITLSGSRRLNRPSYSALNPAVLYENEYSYSTGNPLLDPSFSYQAQLGYTYRQNLNFEITYQYVADGFGKLIRMDSESNTSSSTYYNYFKKRLFMLVNSYTYNTLSWLQVHLQHGIYWTEAVPDEQYSSGSFSGWTYFAQNYDYFYFNKQKTFIGYLILNYSSKTYAADSYTNPSFALTVGAKCTWAKPRLTFALSANDIVATHYKGTCFSNNLTTHFNHNYRYPTLQLSVIWQWGGNITFKNRLKANSEELNRL